MQISGGPLDFKNYRIGFFFSGTVGTFELSGGTGSSTGNVLSPRGTYAFNGSYTIAPGQTVQLRSTFTGSGDLTQIRSITFSTPVPEPSTYALGAIATGVTAVAARRSKARRA